MTLFRQIVLMTLLLFSLLLVVVLSLEFSHTRAYLARQMQSDVQNTVTSLGLSLLPHLQAGDRASAESVVNVIFDGGYYQRISLLKPGGETLVDRQIQTRVLSVPEWFTGLDLFEPVTEENVLTSGWMQLGTLRVSGHPGYAYQQLWQQVSGLLTWFVGAFIVVVTALVYGIRYLLWPLGQLQQRARSIERQQFGEPLPEPRIQELRGVVSAFNSMSEKLRQLFEEQAAETENLRRKAYTDSLTGIANRQFFGIQLEHWLSEPGEGGVALIGTRGLDVLEQEQGYQARDAVIRAKAETVQHWLHSIPGALVARLSKTELAVILPGLDEEQVEKHATELIDELSSALSLAGNDHQLSCCIGVVIRRPEQSGTEMLSQADLALQQARNNRQRHLQLIRAGTDQPTLGRERWRHLVMDALAHQRFYFERQPVLRYSDGSLKALELYTGIDHGQRYHAAQFMPFIDQFKLGGEVDRAILTAIAPRLAECEVPLTVNLSESAIADNAFAIWLRIFLVRLGPARQGLSFDLPEEALVRSKAQLLELCRLLSELEVAFGFDRMGLHLEHLRELAELNPAYVKVDADLVLGHDGQGDIQFLNALARMVHTQEVKVILTRIERAEQLELVKGAPIDGYQGFIAPPEDWAPN